MANFKTQNITFGRKELELRLDGKSIMEIETRLGNKSIYLLFTKNGEQNIPTVKEMLVLIHGCVTTPNVSQASMIDLLNNFLEDGKGPMELMELCMEILDEGGFFGRTQAENTNHDTLLEVNQEQEVTEATEENPLEL